MIQKDLLVDYIFYADCHGLISLTPWDSKLFGMLKISAKANEQRFPVFGTIPLTQKVHDELQKMCLNKDDRKVALMAIKEARYNLPTSEISHQISNMKRIPDDRLDPFWSDPEEDRETKEEAKALLEES